MAASKTFADKKPADKKLAGTTHRERQDAAIVATTELLATKSFVEILTAEEERGLIAAFPQLRALATEMGCIDQPLSSWSRTQIMRFLAVSIRAAVPLRTLPDHEAFRVLNDEIPF